MRFDHATLENGLHLIGEYNAAAKSMAMGFFVRTGSRDETPEIAGVSHFLEHMMFKGSERRSAADVNREFDEIGARYNAFTSEENTVYFGQVLPEFQGRLLDLLADLLRPSLRPEDFDTEKQVILEEIAMYQDQPEMVLYDLTRALYFGPHPLGHSVLGTPESITALTREQMLAYFERRYAPNNLTLALAGHYDWEAAVEQAQALCRDWIPAEAVRTLEASQPQPHLQVVTTDRFNRAHLAFFSPGRSAQQEDRLVAEVVATVLGASRGSRLYWALVDPGLAEAAQTAHSEEDGAGVFYTYATCDPERSQEVVDLVRREMDALANNGVTADEVARAKRKIAAGMVLGGETPMGRLVPMGYDWVYRREQKPLQEDLDALLAIEVDQVHQFLAACPFEPLTIVALGPVESLS